jgi:hypothetical protein
MDKKQSVAMIVAASLATMSSVGLAAGYGASSKSQAQPQTQTQQKQQNQYQYKHQKQMKKGKGGEVMEKPAGGEVMENQPSQIQLNEQRTIEDRVGPGPVA